MIMALKSLAALFGLSSASTTAQNFEVGQVWQYKTRPGESDSRLYIVKVESGRNGKRIFHIYVDRLKMKNPMLAGGVQTELPHAPVSEKTLKLSVTQLQEKTDVLPDIAEEYGAWKEDYDRGYDCVIKISVSELITQGERIIAALANPHS